MYFPNYFYDLIIWEARREKMDQTTGAKNAF